MCYQKLKAFSICAMLVSCLSFSLSCGATTVAPEQVKQEKTITVPVSKLKALRSLLDVQEQKINLLEKQFQQPKTELMKQQQLISRLQNSLTTAQNSLTKSEQIIKEQNSSLTKLSETIKKTNTRGKKLEAQRTFWQVTATCLGVILVKNH